MITLEKLTNPNPKRERGTLKSSESLAHETADLAPDCWFMVSRRALAPVAACGEATKPELAPNGSRNQQSLTLRVGIMAAVYLIYDSRDNSLAAWQDKRTMAGLADTD